ncbi:MAG: hypothetical protein LBR10_02800 [Prevotellaceae bacterium]|nr:hypothetical protein [Prevotellaceae bacterium]
MASNMIPQLIYNYCAAIAGLFSLCLFCNLFTKISIRKIETLIIYTGQNTLIILCTHMVFIGYSSTYIKSYIHNKIMYKSIEFIFVWLLCYAMIFIINKYVPWMVNKKK